MVSMVFIGHKWPKKCLKKNFLKKMKKNEKNC